MLPTEKLALEKWEGLVNKPPDQRAAFRRKWESDPDWQFLEIRKVESEKEKNIKHNERRNMTFQDLKRKLGKPGAKRYREAMMDMGRVKVRAESLALCLGVFQFSR